LKIDSKFLLPINPRLPTLALALLLGFHSPGANAEPGLEAGWANPPREARLRAYWWWLNGNVTKASITHDLEEMKAKGFGGAVIIDAGGAAQDGNENVPHGPTFFTPAWRELYRHALREADRLDLEMSLNIQSGWNLGGPVVSKDDAAKKYVWAETNVPGGARVVIKLPQPKARENFYRDAALVAYPIKANSAKHEPLKNFKQKALQASLEPASAPSSAPLFAEIPATPGEQDADAPEVLDLSGNLSSDGTLNWDAPAGHWQVLRFGYTIGDHAYVSTSSEGWGGFALDVYSATAFQNYWNQIVEPLIADAGPLAGKTLKFLHTDSWEIELANWTPTFPAEFRKRRGYDPLPWLPVLAGHIIGSREASDRFLFDYRKTLGDLAIDDHYRLFRDNAHRHGLGIHPESGGPHAVPIDAQRCLGWDDVPMSEFWAWSWTHRIGDENRFFVKQPASAAHTYGHRITQDEGFTTLGPNWQERIWDNLKPAFDKALCEGMNRLVWHAFVCSPEATGVPGQQYFAGTHLNPKVTWWSKSAPFFSYINRCQFLLQRGLFVADACYYYGDHVPNFAQLRKSDPARLGAGYDYDVVTAEVILERMKVRKGRLVLPDGMSYRLLVLPDRTEISPPVLRKLKDFAAAGATILGPRPERASALADFPAGDAEVRRLADELWGKGRVCTNQTAREVLLNQGVKPDFEWECSGDAIPEINYLHRADARTEIYCVANRSSNAVALNCTFRVTDKAPELWDAVSGEHRFATAYTRNDGRTTLPIELGPCGSLFVVFREPAANHPARTKSNGAEFRTLAELSGPWTVSFDPKWGGPESAQFESLVSWTSRSEPGIKYYSGTAAYRKEFEIPRLAASQSLWLDLGEVRELAEVKVNGRSCGIVWLPPFRVDITQALRPGKNQLEVEVVNYWPNRIIGDQFLSNSERFTRTNIRRLTRDTALMPSGLLGPVRLLESTAR